MKKKYIRTFESYVEDLKAKSLNEESLHEAKGPSKDFGLGAKTLKNLKVGDLVWREMERHNPQLGVYYTLDKKEVAKVTGRKIWVVDEFYSPNQNFDPDDYYDRDTGDKGINRRAAYGSAYYSLLTHQQVLDAIKQNPDKYRDNTVKNVKSMNVSKAKAFLNEGNAFVYARQKAIDNDEDEFEFNGKTYPVTGDRKGGKSLKESELNEAEKIACLECDEVNTKAKWKKNNGFCPSCNVSTQGVKESISENKVFNKEGKSPHKDLVTVGSDVPGWGVVQSYKKKGKDTYEVKYDSGKTQTLTLQHGTWIEESENIDEARDPKTIQKKYSELKKLSTKELQAMWSKSYKVGNPKELDKEGLISDILRSTYGDKYVDAAFESISLNERKDDFGGPGLIVVGKSKKDNDLIDQATEESGFYGIYNKRENYWFFPEEGDQATINKLENELETIFMKRGANVRYEAQYESLDEGNAFVNAKRKAEEEGKDEFWFDGKTYKTK